VDLWPSSWIARLLSGDLRRAKKNHAVVFQIIRDIVQEHLKGGGDEAEDLVDVLLKVHKDGGVDMLGVEAVIFVHIDN
jgi:cytochrome P450